MIFLTKTKMNVSEGPQKPEGYDDKLDNLKFIKAKVPFQYPQTLDELRDMANGGDLDGIRGQYYPGWEDNDFKSLLEELGEKL